MRRKSILSLAVVFLVVLVQGQARAAYSGLPTSGVALSGTRDVPLTIKIVFIGLTSADINTTYLTTAINLPSEKPQSILLSSGITAGVTFKLTYQTTFADSAAVSSLQTYLKSVQRNVTTIVGPPGVTNPPQNPYFNESTRNLSKVNNFFYDANKVESWFNSSQSFGTPPIPGYTLYVADLHSWVPSLNYSRYQDYNTKCPPTCLSSKTTGEAHYYNTTVVDPDLGLVEPRPFMTGWGGEARSYFIDLSAGPSFWTNEPPIQVAQHIRGIADSSPYLLNWRTQYVADYVAGAVYNLFAPDQLYPVSYSAKYVFHLFIFDARNSTELVKGPRITSTVNVPMIRNQLVKLVPFANVTIIPKFANLTSSPGLYRTISNATTSITTANRVYGTLANYTNVDARLVYNWLSIEGHISQFINATLTTNQIDIPEFIFVFSGDLDFGFTFKGDIAQHLPRTIFGVSLPDLVLISHSQSDLNAGNYYPSTGYTQPGKGIGLTRTIVHESGHELGLVHPFMYDIDEDFVNSVMAYYPDATGYSQFDRDLELRGVNDELLIYAQVTLANTASSLLNIGSIAAARQAMTTADQKYASMDYAGAVSYSLSAAENAASAQAAGSFFATFNAAVAYLLLGIIVGAAIGLVTGFLVFRKRAVSGLAYYHCPTCNRPLRWDPAMMRWYCDYCQKPV